MKTMGFVNMPGNDLRCDCQQEYFFISFIAAKLQGHIHQPVSQSALSHFRFQHEKTELCCLSINFCNGNASGRYAITFQDIQGSRS